ncbi:hypothetical protein CSC3H3_06550 [Thalassospira marina]|uniref:Uncharacterized protein n=1 Tax=Thalassospira marina TaxID=2048283 RepID=A0ABN5FCE7_9PROT|nr:hypothetical protein CSC3H3_06550 [Thalassospira marina]
MGGPVGEAAKLELAAVCDIAANVRKVRMADQRGLRPPPKFKPAEFELGKRQITPVTGELV